MLLLGLSRQGWPQANRLTTKPGIKPGLVGLLQ